MHQRALSRDEVREVDRRAVERLGVPSALLMENAGRGASEAVLGFARERRALDRPRLAIFCGRGNNGGDGWVVARHASLAGAVVEVFSVATLAELRGDARLMREIAERMELPSRDVARPGEVGDLERFDVLVDALLGTGFEGELSAAMLEWVRGLNAARQPLRVALDLPTGLDCDTGRPSPEAFRADLTATFVAPKLGFERAEAQSFLGRVVVCSIGVGAAVLELPAR